jgi:hypothetical protein
LKILILLSLLSAPVLAEMTINKPLLILMDKSGNVVATASTSIEKAMEKASKLPDGSYTLIRPDVTITVLHKIPNQAPVAVTGGDQTVTEGELVFLPGCGLSYDPDGTIAKCEYTQTGGIPVEIHYTPTGEAYFYKPHTSESIAHCVAPDDFLRKV